MKIKVCGITRLGQMQQLQKLGVDYTGMIFYKGSKRYIDDKIRNQKSEIRNLSINKVGVFVNAGYKAIIKAIEDYHLDVIQLHGDETDEFCLALMDRVKVIKVFKLTGEENIDELTKPFLHVCHYFMFDTAPAVPMGGKALTQPSLSGNTLINNDPSKSKVSELDNPPWGGGEAGGTGLQFDWGILEKAKINKPFFLSGGIGLEDIKKIKSFEHPYLFAVDVNSRFEISPGIKDINKVKQFINKISHE